MIIFLLACLEFLTIFTLFILIININKIIIIIKILINLIHAYNIEVGTMNICNSTKIQLLNFLNEILNDLNSESITDYVFILIDKN